MEQDYEKILGQVKKPRKNSRTKGAANERSLCKHLQAWTGHEFARVPSSGGLRWKEGQNIVGDLVCTDPKALFPFSVETKHYEKVTCVVKNEFLAPTCTMHKIWSQACRDAEREGKIPLCFIKENKQRGWTVYMAYTDYVLLGIHGFIYNEVSYTLPDAVEARYANVFVTFPSSSLFSLDFEHLMDMYKVNYEE